LGLRKLRVECVLARRCWLCLGFGRTFADCAARVSRAKWASSAWETTFCSAPCHGMLCFAACIAEYLPASQISILHHAANLELPPTIFDEPLQISRLQPFTSVQKPPQTFHKWRPGFDVAERYGGQTKPSDRECCQMTLGPLPNRLSAVVSGGRTC
jgi:hypothetical protein